MSSLFRSETMFLYTIVVHPESAFDCIVELGYVGAAQLVNVYDGNVVPNMKYAHPLERSRDMLRTIEILQEESNKMDVHIYYYPNVDTDEIPRENDLHSIDEILKALGQELAEVTEHCNALLSQKLSLLENREVLLKTQDFLTGARNTEAQITGSDSMMGNLLQDAAMRRESRNDRTPLRLISGSVSIKRFEAFEIMVWRISRGNAYIKHVNFRLPDEYTQKEGQEHFKTAFIIAFVGETLESKLLKVSQGFRVNLFPCPETHKERQRALMNINKDLEDLDEILKQSFQHKTRILLAAAPELYIWRSKVRKMRDVYFVLNHMGRVRELRKMNKKYLQVDSWIPEYSLKKVRAALNRGAWRAAEGDPTQVFPPILHKRDFSDKIRPPTLFRTNKFTNGFQNLVDAYGIASYREINPAPYAIVTFPFLFAVMFGDTGHGLLVTLFAWFLIHKEEKFKREQKEAIKPSEIFNIIFAGRYILLLMGVFSIYTGLIYNDNFSKAANIFGSSWRVNLTRHDIKTYENINLDPARADHYRGEPYIMGMDPVWGAAPKNYIRMSNSFKMKMSIILGVAQMIFGLCLSACNAVQHRSKIDLFFVFLPQLVFFLSLFFYLVILIFFKWYMYGGHLQSTRSAGCAPSILIVFINMVLFKGAEKIREGCNDWMFPGQQILEWLLIFAAFVSIPILLCGKPIHFALQHKRIHKIADPERKATIRRATIEDMRKSLIYSVDDLPAYRDDEEDQQLSEVWIHSGIHTIECVLGSVSHTASYLRLWALSLAHAELSSVLWHMILSSFGLKQRYGFYHSIILYVTFAIFALLTVSILVIMEGLSAFLHTLRLHWVEFQSKFYKGAGEAFSPFYFKESTRMDAVSTTKSVR